jgi:CBS domain-containing protein
MKKVKDLMVPLSEYATVSEEATLFDAITALKESQKAFDQTRYRHRAVLIYDKDRRIVGKVSQLDILRALEPKYNKVEESAAGYGFSRRLLKSMFQQYRLWNEPLADICRKAVKWKVKTFMYTPSEGEYVDYDASLNEAIHQLVMGHHQSLLVVENDRIVGILRLTDVFKEVCEIIRSCEA